MLTQGQVIDRYSVEALIGQGGMATVYRVRHVHLGTDRALKVMSLLHPSVRRRLLQEGRLQASLSHPHVVGVSDVLDVGGSPALLMELVAGPSLEQWAALHPPSMDEALALFRDVVAGVSYAHDRGLVHRDLKPANVLIVRQGDGLLAKVADFGLAKVVEDELGTSGATRTGTGMGTPAYMSPEQIRDAKRVDQRADVFALGCILYELTCGRRAFEGEDLLTLMTRIVAGDYQPPRELRADLPREVEATILGCLVADRDARLPTCQAVLESLPPPSPVRWSAEALAAALPPPEQALQPHPSSPPSGSQPPPTPVTGGAHHPTATPGPTSGSWSGRSQTEPSSETWFPAPAGTAPAGPDRSGTMVPDDRVPDDRVPDDRVPVDRVPDDRVPGTRGPGPAAGGRRGPLVAAVVVALAIAGGLIAWGLRPEPTPADPAPPPRAGSRIGAPEALPAEIPAAEPPAAEIPAAEIPAAEIPAAEIPATALPAAEPTAAGSSTAAPPTAATPTAAPSTAAPSTAAPPAAEPPAAETPAAETPAAETPAATGTVRVTGDARSVTLRGPAGTFLPGPVPAGTYQITATFDGRAPAAAGQVTVPAGKEIELRCTSAFVKCVP